ncbi:MAG TPA: TrkA family potassium uptake protein [Acidimicrobiales bacterium]|nr:TrkA family potassium uptake protein [Acidimicrobiales bacterium]
MHVIVAGGGALGDQLARALESAGNTVAVVEADAGRAAELAASGRQVFQGDACTSRSLEAAGALHADVLVACTDHDEVNLVISILARRHFDVPRVVATVRDDANRWLFGPDWGVDAAISSAAALVGLIEEATGSARTVRLADLADTGLVLVEVNVTAGSAALGMTVAELPLPSGDLVAAVIPRGRPPRPVADTLPFKVGDRVLVVTRPNGEALVHAAFYPDSDKSPQ